MPPSDDSLGSGFRALFIGSLVSNTGDGIRLAALPLLAAELTSSPVLVSAVTAAQFLPWVSVAPLGGALVDRHDRRRMIVTTQLWRGLVMAVLAALVATDLIAIWHLCVVAFLITAGEILVDPCVVALVPELVADERLDVANGRIASAEIVTNDFAGGPVGATAFGFAPWLPFMVDAISYLGSVLAFRRLPTLPSSAARSSLLATERVESRSLRAEAADGLRYLRSHPVLWPVTTATMVFYVGAAVPLSLLVLLVRERSGGEPWTYGVLLACGAVGAFLGTRMGSAVSKRFGTRTTLAAATGLEGLALVAMAWPSSTVALAAIWFLGGVPAGVRIPVARSLQQRLTDNRFLGRVNVSTRMFTRGIIVVGALVSGAIATVVSVPATFAIGGAIQLLAAFLLARALGDASAAPAAAVPPAD